MNGAASVPQLVVATLEGHNIGSISRKHSTQVRFWRAEINLSQQVALLDPPIGIAVQNIFGIIDSIPNGCIANGLVWVT